MYKRRRYPRNWPALARACKDRACWRCERCQVPQGRRRKSPYSGRWYRVCLVAHHPDRDWWNPAPRLVALCERCHGLEEWAYRRAWLSPAAWERVKHRILLKRRGYKTRQY